MIEVKIDKRVKAKSTKKAELPDEIKAILEDPFADGAGEQAARLLYGYSLSQTFPNYVTADMEWEWGSDGFRIVGGEGTYGGNAVNINLSRCMDDLRIYHEADFGVVSNKNGGIRSAFVEKDGRKIFLTHGFALVQNLDKVTGLEVGVARLFPYEEARRGERDLYAMTTGFEDLRDDLGYGELIDKHLRVLSNAVLEQPLDARMSGHLSENGGLSAATIRAASHPNNGTFCLYLRDPSVARVRGAAEKLREFTDFYKEHKTDVKALVARLDCPHCHDEATALIRKMGIPTGLAPYLPTE